MMNKQALLDKVRTVKRAHEKMLLSKPNVVGVGIGFRFQEGRRTDSFAIVVMVRRKLPVSQLAPEDVIPTEIDGVPVDVQETGEFEAQT